jgi:hypothetical protein
MATSAEVNLSGNWFGTCDFALSHTHLSKCVPYRNPARRAAWMREYRKRKRLGNTGAPASLPTATYGVRAAESSRVSPKTIDSSGPNPRL